MKNLFKIIAIVLILMPTFVLATADMQASSAGVANVNGIYCINGTYESRTRYDNENGLVMLVSDNSHTYWEFWDLAHAVNYYFAGPVGDTATTPPNGLTYNTGTPPIVTTYDCNPPPATPDFGDVFIFFYQEE